MDHQRLGDAWDDSRGLGVRDLGQATDRIGVLAVRGIRADR